MTDDMSVDQDDNEDDFFLPEYFKKEFPHLSRFLEENLINKTSEENDREKERVI